MKINYFLIAALAFPAGMAFAQGPVAPAAPRQSAGFVALPGSQKGQIAIVNKQSRFPAKELAEIAAFIEGQTLCKTIVGPGEGSQIIVEVVDDSSLPALVAYPEDFKAVMNVGKLDVGLKGSALDKFFVSRCRKELLRAFCFACGAGGSQYPDNIMAIGKIQDLDLIQEFIPGDTIYACQRRAKSAGVTQKLFVSYARACKEGWAPAPTNDVQRIVFEKVKALKEKGPTNPIKIAPPKK